MTAPRKLAFALVAITALSELWSCGRNTHADFRALPAAPTRLSARALLGSAGLTWVAADGADGYVVYVGSADRLTRDNASAAFPVTETAFLTPAVAAHSSVSFAVASRSRDFESDLSATAHITPQQRLAIDMRSMWARVFSPGVGGLSTAGDVDGDGYDEVAVGLPAAGGGDVVLFRGGPLSPEQTPLQTLTTSTGGVQFGAHIFFGGDLDGDGIGDLLIQAPSETSDDGLVSAGRLELRAGTGTGFSAVADAHADGIENNEVAFSVVRIVDLDGDGAPDIVAASPQWNSNTGRIDVFRGPLKPGRQPIASSLVGSAPFTSFGLNFAIFDADLDGAPDLISRDLSGGDVDLFPGAAGGFLQSPQRIVATTGSNGAFGIALLVADFGGGDEDLVISAPDDVVNGSIRVGDVFFYRATPTGLVLTRTIAGTHANGAIGRALAAGDFNGDGFTDLAVSEAPGRVLLFAGSAAGLDPAFYQELISPDGFGAGFGADLLALGDVNGDGVEDLGVLETSFPIPPSSGTRVRIYAGARVNPSGPAVDAGPAITSFRETPVHLSSPALDATVVRCSIDWGDDAPAVTIDPCTESRLAIASHVYGFPSTFAIHVRGFDDSDLAGESVTNAVIRESP